MNPTTLTSAPVRKYRKDYRPPTFWIERVELEFDLGEEATEVRSRLQLVRNPDVERGPLELDGEELETLWVKVDGRTLEAGEYELGTESLTLHDLPDRCVLETAVRIDPDGNSSLSGLYRTSGNYCTQCEAEGFRRITWFLDRPDVMAVYSTTITADPARCPVMLSNGNRVHAEDLPDGRRRVRWEDPFKKPSYLFALVAGDLRCHAGTFTTRSGREVALEIWVEPQNVDACEHALVSLQNAMRWDEETFGLEYDLDVYMVVAVNDFNMGAMENKGLNVFNSKFVLARPETATDDDYEGIEGVIGHEYFHNWTGNRVTCRDWFQLTLKEGLTVFRDQQFSSDMGSAAVHRVSEVARLRLGQFPEDAGPMAHPIRPESYLEMDNFYTATVYQKGAEVIRMYHTLLGADGFRKGMDLYFERHDGEAVTCDDFRAAMADANGRDLAQFERWYLQAGTPVLRARLTHDAAARTATLELEQRAPKGQEDGWKPLHLPVRMGLLGPDGADLPLVLEGEDAAGAPTERVLELTEPRHTFVFQGVDARPVPSLLRDFSAPVVLEAEDTAADLAFRLAHDADPFNRREAGQELMTQAVLAQVARHQRGEALELDVDLSAAFGSVLADEGLDGSMRALTLALPGERVLAQRQDVIDPDALYAARSFVRDALARAHEPALRATFEATRPPGAYSAERADIDRRRLHNLCLGYLCCLDVEPSAALAMEQFRAADNMTDSQAALGCLVQLDHPARQEALDDFHARWKADPLVLDKWFTLQAGCRLPGAVDRLRALSQHPDFTLKNPNRARSLVHAFAIANPTGFHQADGAGYELVGDLLLELDGINPQVAARLAASFNSWRRYDEARQQKMRVVLERVVAHEGLSKNTYEIVSRALEG